MRGIKIVPSFDHGEEIDRDQMRALVEQLKHRVLRIGAHSAPCYRRARAAKRRALRSNAFAV